MAENFKSFEAVFTLVLKGKMYCMGKKLVQINTVCNTSTGKIMGDIQREAMKQGYDTISFIGRRKPFADIPCERFGNPISFWIHVAITTAFDRQGYGSYFTTKKLIRRLREEKPDIIHLHNLHGYYLYLPLLFRYLKEEFQGQLFWTFHDCWPFTGHCAYFTAAGCNKWKNECNHCPNKMVYPISLIMDSSKRNFGDKQELFRGLKNLTIITPSQWLKELVEKSFLGEYLVKVVNNGIDLQRFSYRKPTRVLLDKYAILKNKKILLGVANIWDKRKGLDDFLDLAKVLTKEYKIVLVGLSKRQINSLPHNIVGIQRTEDVEELAMLYSAAHIFINPSLEETFSLVTVEAMACGTPVIVLDTSAVKELVCENNGLVLRKHGTKDYLEAIQKLEKETLSRETVSSTVKKYDVRKFASNIVQLYK